MPVALLALALVAAEPVAQLDLRPLSFDAQLTALALAGLVNRAGPRLYLDTSAVNWPNPAADGYWRDWYTAHKGLAFEPAAAFETVVKRFDGAWRGLVIYDPRRDGSRWVAMTLAGLDDLLPVTAELQAQLHLADKPVVHDLRGRFDTDLAAYHWAAETLLPRCPADAVYSAGRSHDDVKLGGDPTSTLAADYGVAQRMFFFNLSFSPKPTAYYGTDVPGYPDQVAQLDAILDRLRRPAAVWGWCEPEGDFAHHVSAHGHFVVCGSAPNLSFHHGVPAEPKALRQKRHAAPVADKLEEKTYVTVLTNEGDTPKALISEYLRGWSEPERGQVAVNWLVNPYLLSLFPAAAEHYYDTATDADYFECAVSGAGYTLLSALPGTETFGAWTRRWLPFADLRGIDVWTDNDDPATLGRYAAQTGAEFISLEGPGPRDVSFVGEVPVSRTGEGLSYWVFNDKVKTLEKLAALVRQQAAETPRPNFVQIYSGTSPKQWLQLAKMLGDDFRLVRLDDYLALARRDALLRIAPPVVYASPGERFKARLTARSVVEQEDVEIKAEPGAASFAGATWRLVARRGETAAVDIVGQVIGNTPLGDNTVTVTDTRGNHARARLRVVETGFDERFESDAGWQGWGGAHAKLVVKEGHAHLINPPALPYSAVEKRVTLDVDRYPTLLVDVPSGAAACAVKVRPADRMEDVILVPDTRQHGILTGNLAATGWHGVRTFYVIVFVAGAGDAVDLDRLRFVR
jgi:hypothetical protein